jgi:transposase
VSQDGTSILFGLRGVKVRGVERGDGGELSGDVEGAGARVVHLLTDDPSEGACPACGVVSTSVRQRRTTRPRDLPYGEQALVVRWHKTQWSCRESACRRKAFTDQIAELPAGARVTGRLRRHVAGRVAAGLAVSVAGGALLSWPISHAA